MFVNTSPGFSSGNNWQMYICVVLLASVLAAVQNVTFKKYILFYMYKIILSTMDFRMIIDKCTFVLCSLPVLWPQYRMLLWWGDCPAENTMAILLTIRKCTFVLCSLPVLWPQYRMLLWWRGCQAEDQYRHLWEVWGRWCVSELSSQHWGHQLWQVSLWLLQAWRNASGFPWCVSA